MQLKVFWAGLVTLLLATIERLSWTWNRVLMQELNFIQETKGPDSFIFLVLPGHLI